MVFSHQQGSMMDSGSDALAPHGAFAATFSVPFDTVVGDTSGGDMKAAAIAAGLAGWTDSLPLIKIDTEYSGREQVVVFRR